MNYAYDITVNLKPNYLDFFEWDNSDNLQHLKKVPVIKLETEELINIISNIIVVEQDFLKKIHYKNNYICLFISDDNSLVCKFNNKGKCILKSSLLVDEELDIMENYYNLDLSNVKYEVVKICQNTFITRHEKETIKFLNNEISKLTLPKDSNKIKYLYIEAYGKFEQDSLKALSTIKNSLKMHHKIDELYKFMKIIETNQIS